MKNNKNLKRILKLIYLILLCSIFIAVSFSKNVSKVDGEIETNVAGIILNIETSDSISYLTNEYQSINFTVANYEEATCNETEYEYQISIDSKNDVAITYELFKIEDDEEVTVEVTNGTTETFTMPHTETEEDEYVLKVKLDDTDYAGISDTLTISAYAVQSN